MTSTAEKMQVTTSANPQKRLIRFVDELDHQLTREWLITNGRGGFATGTTVGVPTRRYHGLLIASARPPLDRWLLLAAVLERVGAGERTWETPCFEFDHSFHPRGYQYQTSFAARNDPTAPWVRFDYQFEELHFTKQLVMMPDENEVLLIYRLQGPEGMELSLDLCPFTAMRDFHACTQHFDGGFPTHQVEDRVAVEAFLGGPRLWLKVERTDGGAPAAFQSKPDWWYGFVHREETARGFGGPEDLFVPGWFRARGNGRIELILRGYADFSGSGSERLTAPAVVPQIRQDDTQSVEDRLREAAGTFVVGRQRAEGGHSATILAGYHWFGDWGRDAFIALPGLLLETKRFAEAREVLATFASAQQDGLIPNRFSDYGDGCDYNSVDASLWYIHAAARYLEASGDRAAWDEFLSITCGRIIDAFVQGTRFNIRVDSDGLVACGDASTQLTWMDAKFGDVVFTPRHGKPVEINALWHHALCELAALTRSEDPQRTSRYHGLAAQARRSFRKFWNDSNRCLYDVVRDEWRDGAVRPNQIFAVSLRHSPLDEIQQRAVLSCVECELLTPYGLRSLSPRDSRYRGRYQGGPFDRDSSYHQGTVWGWLIGPYIEAYLRVHDFSLQAKARARLRLQALAEHLDAAGIGSVSEIFDGDPPHLPRGCIAQAWSVGELLRAWRMTQPG
ncbi:MAG: 4-alpha-glucanotransferase [Phycisphaerae bacterium]